jgi:hypothetical protein
MTAMIPTPGPHGAFAPQASNRVVGQPTVGAVGVFRLPTDPLFYADLVLQNIVSGSRYRVTKADDDTELATGEAGSTTVTLSGLAVYANPMLVKITVRKGTSAPKYQPLDTFAYMGRGTTSAFIAQIPDPIA